MFHFSTRPSLIFFTMLIFLSSSFSMSLDENQAVDLGAICSHTLTDQAFCIRLLNSTPPGPDADLVTLAQYTTDAARTNVTNIITLIKNLIASGGHGQEQYLEKCLLEYSGNQGALQCLDDIQKSLESKDYSAMDQSVMTLLGRNSNCILDKVGANADELSPDDPKLLDEYGIILAKVGVVLHDIIVYLNVKE